MELIPPVAKTVHDAAYGWTAEQKFWRFSLRRTDEKYSSTTWGAGRTRLGTGFLTWHLQLMIRFTAVADLLPEEDTLHDTDAEDERSGAGMSYECLVRPERSLGSKSSKTEWKLREVQQHE
jgi:hypothetical protein